MYPYLTSAASCLLLCGEAIGASLPPSPSVNDLIRQQQQQQRLLDQQQQRIQDLQQLPQATQATPVVPAPADTRCFDIQRITLKGAEHLSESVRDDLLAPGIGKCLGAGQLNELLKVITNQYVDRGYWRNQLRWRRPIPQASLQPWLQKYGAALAYDMRD